MSSLATKKRKVLKVAVSSLLLATQLNAQQTWTKVDMRFDTGDSSFSWWEARFVSKNAGWFAGNVTSPTLNCRIFKTTDGGSTWKTSFDAHNYGLSNLFAIDSLHAWAFRARKGIVLTADGGITWDSASVDPSWYDIGGGALYFFDPETGFAFNRYLMKTIDGGHSWSIDNANDSLLVRHTWAVDFVDRNQGWIGGGHPVATDAGFLGVTSDGGNSWAFQNDPGYTYPIAALDFSDALHGMAVGYGVFSLSGVVYRTTDGGSLWLDSLILPLGYFPDIKCADSQRAWISGAGGTLLETTDGGEDWIPQFSGVTADLKHISVLNAENTVYVIGDSSTLLRRDLIVGVGDSDNNMNNGSPFLLAAYPNPFNASTRISYRLAFASQVRLKVYDVLGEEVTSLVEGYMQPGTWSTEFDGSQLPSGIYFYRLTAREFVDVKKMMLVR